MEHPHSWSNFYSADAPSGPENVSRELQLRQLNSPTAPGKIGMGKILQLRRCSNCADAPTAPIVSVPMLQLRRCSNCADSPTVSIVSIPILQLRRCSNCADFLNSNSPTVTMLQLCQFSKSADSPITDSQVCRFSVE